MNDLEEHFDRLKWVAAEIERLSDQLLAYTESKPLEVYWHYDFHPASLFRIYKLRLREAVPRSAVIHAGSIINEMRAILDALVCTLALRNGAKDLSSTAFPTAKDRASFESRDVRRKIRLISDEDKQWIANLEPYQGGNEMLYALHSTDIIRKHRRLLYVGSDVEKTTLGNNNGWVLDGSKIDFIRGGPGHSLNEPIARVAHDYDLEIEQHAFVAFSEPDEIRGKAVIKTLSEFSVLVHGILEFFERS